MGSVKKDDARIEKIIRVLLKLPENRRCINCNLLGPQYVCTTFSTFVCTSCSGIHREFTHRVKSVSMAKFTSDEVEALQAGGNERAKQIYFKEWNPLRHSYPDSNNIHRLRDFIKHVYVDRKFTGDSPVDLPRLRLADKEESHQSRKISSFRIEPKSPAYEDRAERLSSARSSPSLRSDDKSLRFYYDERRSPRYAQNYSRHASLGRKPIQFEVVDDRFRDDESRNRRPMNLDSKLRQLQPGSQKTANESQSPVVRSLREVLGENGSSPKVSEPSQAQNKEAHDLPLNQASDAAAEPETQPISQSSEENWANFEDYAVDNAAENSNSNNLTSSVTVTTPQATYANSLDLLLSELSGPLTAATAGLSDVSIGNNDPTTATVENSSTHGDSQQLPPSPMGQATASPKNSDALSITPTPANEMEQPSNAVPSNAELFDREDLNEVSDGQKLSSMQFRPSVSVGGSSTTQPTSTPITPVASNDMPSDVLDSHDSLNAFTELSPQATSRLAQDTKPDVDSKPSAVETKSSGRKELPADLFTTSYLSGPAPLSGWHNAQPHGMHNVQPHGMGYGLQYYPNAVPPSAFPVAAKSSNPFEVTEGRSLAHTSSFPTLASMRGALPPISSRTGLMHASSYGSLGMVPHSTSYGSPVHPQSTIASGFPNGAYFGQVSTMQAPRPERAAGFSDDKSAFGSLGSMQASSGEYMTPTTPNSLSKKGGNPFGDD